MSDNTTIITDRSAIATLIERTLLMLDEKREAHALRTQVVDDLRGQKELLEAAYAEGIAEALSTGWFTEEGLAGQGHVSPTKLPKRAPASAVPSISREDIPQLIAETLNGLDKLKAVAQDASRNAADAEQIGAAASLEYAAVIAEALSTGWFTEEGLAGQGHHLPKPKRGRGGRKKAAPQQAGATGAADPEGGHFDASDQPTG